VIRDRIAEAALRAYPPGVRRAQGPEMLGMLLDAGGQSNRAFLSESWSLVLGGLRARAAITARSGTRRLIADSCCLAVLIWLMFLLANAVGNEIAFGHLIWGRALLRPVILAAILVCALVGYERIAAIGGLAAIMLSAITASDLQSELLSLASLLGLLVCLLVMLCAPQRRSRDLRRLVWLLAVCVLVALNHYANIKILDVFVVVSVAGLLRLFHDPRLALACSLVWVGLLIDSWVTQLTLSGEGGTTNGGVHVLVAAASGVMLTMAGGQLWVMRRRIA
jgi:hypothetical protein